MLTQVCQYLRNWFERTKYMGEFTIASGAITYADGSTLPLLSGQYYRIIGSVLNDGVHKNGDTSDVLKDETFYGSVWSMAVPSEVLGLSVEIATWVTANTAIINSPYQSESFGGYTYSLRGGTNSTGKATGASWQSQFESRLAPWRKI